MDRLLAAPIAERDLRAFGANSRPAAAPNQAAATARPKSGSPVLPISPLDRALVSTHRRFCEEFNLFSLPPLWGRVGVGGEFAAANSHPIPAFPHQRGKEFNFSTARSHSESCVDTNARRGAGTLEALQTNSARGLGPEPESTRAGGSRPLEVFAAFAVRHH